MSDKPTPNPAAELAVVFVIGVSLMSFFYSGTGGAAGAEIGAPGNDSFYHVRMAALIPDHGLVHNFPWLRFAWFTEQGDTFVSHHYGFHLLLLPFVRTAVWLGFDELAGGRWAIATCFGIVLVLFDLLLISEAVRARWLWIAMFVLLPSQFFERHAYIRAIAPSLAMMLLIVWLMFRRRILLTGLAVFAFIHLYLGAVMYAPVIVAAYALAAISGSRGLRGFPWKLVVVTAFGWLAGILTHPYVDGLVEFLQLQVFGTGLSPDISVGREWKPYNDVWWFAATLSGPLLLVTAIALLARLRRGPRLDTHTTTLLLLNLVFFVLTIKARRFIEYWPVFCLLSAAFAAQPVCARLFRFFLSAERIKRPGWWHYLVNAAMLIAAVAIVGLAVRSGALTPFHGATPLIVTGLLILLPIVAARVAVQSHRSRAILVRNMALSIAAVAGVALVGGSRLLEARNNSRCRYDLPSVREMMAYLVDHSKPGDVVFTDDWDVFPLYFYHNTHNRYVVGLDPKFTHDRRPDLWDRYVKITRGQTPATIRSEVDGGEPKTIDVRLEDIRDHFEARFVITDRDHRPLNRQLDEAWDFAELVWPRREDARDSPYRLYRVREAGEIAGARPAAIASPKIVYLSELTPVETEPADVDWRRDRRLDGGALRVKTRTHLRGISVATPATLRYEVPVGATRFESTVCFGTSAAGMTVSVLVDGELLYSETATGVGDSVLTISVPVAQAKQIELRVESLPEAALNEVLWASARFVTD